MSKENEGTPAERLMEVLIQKMESMDGTIQTQQGELKELRKAVTNPMKLFKKMGFVSTKTPFMEDVLPDVFRGDSSGLIKGDDGESHVSFPQSNEEFHNMDWSSIHELADQAKSVGHTGNVSALE
tara:strand:+ start:307 stop:681 length:375 start_codon:yes stop_codon:yes gene_type:complete